MRVVGKLRKFHDIDIITMKNVRTNKTLPGKATAIREQGNYTISTIMKWAQLLRRVDESHTSRGRTSELQAAVQELEKARQQRYLPVHP